MSTAIIMGTLALIMHAGHLVAHGISNNPLTQTNQFITVINELWKSDNKVITTILSES